MFNRNFPVALIRMAGGGVVIENNGYKQETSPAAGPNPQMGDMMSYTINLDEVDSDGAVREAADAVAGDTRLSFLKKAGLAGGAAMSGGALLSVLAPSARAPPGGRPPASFGKGDVGILNYALTLEY